MNVSSRLRKLIALTALVWLPMSVFAQMCATHAIVAGLMGSHQVHQVHQAAVATPKQHTTHTEHHGQDPAALISDTDAIDEHGGCDQKSICAFASLAAVVSTACDLAFDSTEAVSARDVLAFSTRAPAPETPPPRPPA